MSRITRRIEEEMEEEKVTIILDDLNNIEELNRIARRMFLPRKFVVPHLLQKETTMNLIKRLIRNMEDRINKTLIEHRKAITELIKELKENLPNGEQNKS